MFLLYYILKQSSFRKPLAPALAIYEETKGSFFTHIEATTRHVNVSFGSNVMLPLFPRSLTCKNGPFNDYIVIRGSLIN